MKKVNPTFRILDYNDKAPYDCLIYDSKTRDFIRTELEPTLMEWIQHRETDDVAMLITWSLGKWRIGARKNSKTGSFRLTNAAVEGRYKLLEFANARSERPRKDYDVIVLEEVL